MNEARFKKKTPNIVQRKNGEKGEKYNISVNSTLTG